VTAARIPVLPMLRSFAGWRPADLRPDLVAGLTLAAIAVPEQMATARLAGLGPEIGFLALFAGAVGFAVFGANRWLSVGADSTIAPIFAGALAIVAASGEADYAKSAAALALAVGLILVLAGVFRLGFIADLLSIPVTTGFLAGIAVHILASQAPALLGVDSPSAPTMIQKIIALGADASASHFWTLAIGLGVFAIITVGERLDPRIPGALIALLIATGLTAALHLETRGVSTLGSVAGVLPKISIPLISFQSFRDVAPLAVIVSVVVMVQTAATTRSFVSDPAAGPDVNSDFIGVGASNLIAGFTGAFPVDASPPRTAVVAATGGVSQLAALACAALALALSLFGGDLLKQVPHAALAGVLLFIALRIVRLGVMADVWRRSKAEFALIVVTVLAIVLLPIEQGVALGIILSLVHGVWTTTRASTVEYERIAGTSIWWPKSATARGEALPGVSVIGLQAPLSFLNAYQFQQALQTLPKAGVRLVVIEANAIVEIDYTGAKILGDEITRLRGEGVDIAFARLESVRAQASFAKQGLEALIGKNHLFHSVEEAISALGPSRSP
jgi:MFS superfamily sulfate permease-like transporter